MYTYVDVMHACMSAPEVSALRPPPPVANTQPEPEPEPARYSG